MGFPIPDIDVEKIFKALKKGFYQSGFICEGCGIIAVTKTKEGKKQVAFDDQLDWVDVAE